MPNISDDIDPGSLVVPAVYVNRFQIAAMTSVVRITLGERLPDQPTEHRVAVLMTRDDAKALSDAINHVLAKSV